MYKSSKIQLNNFFFKKYKIVIYNFNLKTLC